MKIQHRLLNGENIHMGDLGYFHITLQSKGVDKAEDVNAATIENVLCSGKDLETRLATAELVSGVYGRLPTEWLYDKIE